MYSNLVFINPAIQMNQRQELQCKTVNVQLKAKHTDLNLNLITES